MAPKQGDEAECCRCPAHQTGVLNAVAGPEPYCTYLEEMEVKASECSGGTSGMETYTS